jgi:ABC-type multidrug transport system fused ATPase/permease subunit
MNTYLIGIIVYIEMHCCSYNLDPLNEHSDAELWESLKIAQLNTVVSSLGIDCLRICIHIFLNWISTYAESEVTENGDNFSVGQRQVW